MRIQKRPCMTIRKPRDDVEPIYRRNLESKSTAIVSKGRT